MTKTKLEKTLAKQDLTGFHKHPNGGGWVEDTARVADTAYVGPDARVSGHAKVYGHARVSGHAKVSGHAWVSGHARVSGNAKVSGHAWVSDDAEVSGNAKVSGHAWVSYRESLTAGKAAIVVFLLLGVSLFLVPINVWAQGPPGTTVNSASTENSVGTIGSGGMSDLTKNVKSFNPKSWATPNQPKPNSTAKSGMTSAAGNANYQPTRVVTMAQALALAKRQKAAAQPVSLGTLAARLKAQAVKPKTPAIRFVMGADGHLMMVKPKGGR